MATWFFSGFETGDKSEWSVDLNNGCSVVTSPVNNLAEVPGGFYAASVAMASGASNGLRSMTFTGPAGLYTRCYFQLYGLSANITGQQFRLFDVDSAGSVSILAIYVTTDGSGNPSLVLHNGTTATTYG